MLTDKRAMSGTHMLIIDPHPALGLHSQCWTRYGCFNLQVKKLLRIRGEILVRGWLSPSDSCGLAGSCAAGRAIWWTWRTWRSARELEFAGHA